ncbi:hypothetical protein B0T16DRAFT_402602 [Cercophora newfieldiana]|uniref:NACHT domain-containing protein n=1 Tax=Cercophora newfieldiana TaxID=92897 RepID=A0AA40D115_9PEZI|nr:hypothetical protein B0T16DRAFT_402602 [Cercophora newfieldiana]
MEAIGVVAAVPELLKLAKRVGTAIARISSRREIAKAATGIRAQLDLLTEILESIQHRGQAHEGDNLSPILANTLKELEALGLLVDRVEETKNNGPNIIHRAQLVFSGFDSKLKAKSQRIDRIVRLLQVYIAESAAQDQLQDRARKAIKPSTTAARFIPEKLQGTLEWFWAHKTVELWTGAPVTTRNGGSSSKTPATEMIADIQSRMLLVYGVNGCGKSVLAASVADDLRNRGHFTVFFSFWAGSSNEMRADVMFRTVLWQILVTTPKEQRMAHMARLLESQTDLRNTDGLVSEIQQLANDYNQEIYVIVDGIDESSDDWNDMRGGPLGHISKLLQLIPRLRVLLTGRQPALRSALRRWQLYIELTQELVKDDIDKLIRHELENCSNISDEGIKMHIQAELESKSTVMFLWVKLVFKELRLSFSNAEVRHTLSHVPDQLNQEYNRLFGTLSRRLHGRQSSPSIGMQRAKAILGLVISAARPLTLTELRLAFTYSTTQESDNYDDCMISEEGIIDACGDIITTQGDLVYLGHTSLREFLVSRPSTTGTDENSTPGYFSLEPHSCQRTMALACLRYLRDIQWREPSGKQMSLQSLESRFPFLPYTATYLASHLLSSDMDADEVRDHVASFLGSEEGSSWLEFAISMENDEARQRTLPITFWDDMIQLWSSLALDGPEALPLEGTHSKPRDIHQDFVSRCLAYGLVEELTRIGQQQAPGPCKESNPGFASILSGFQDVPAGARNMGDVRLSSKALHAAVQNWTSMDKLSTSRLSLLLTPIQTWIRNFNALPNPVDAVIQALEKSLQGMSFLALMALTHALMFTRPDDALRMALLALEKVQGKGDLREAWASGVSGDLREEDELRVSHYRRSQVILDSKQQNPLFDIFWCRAADNISRCLFRLEKTDEAKGVLTAATERLLATRGDRTHLKSPKSSILRSQLHNALLHHPWLVSARLKLTVEFGSRCRANDLEEDTERLLRPLIEDRASMKRLNSKSVASVMEDLGFATYRLGKLKESADIWKKERTRLQAQLGGLRAADTAIQDEIDYITMFLVTVLSDMGRHDMARGELQLVNSFSYLKLCLLPELMDDVSLAMDLIHFTSQSSGVSSNDQVIGFVERNLTHIENGFLDEGYNRHDAWRFAARQLLALGIFEEAEILIRKALSQQFIPGQRTLSREELYASEGLAFSLRCQGFKAKRHDPGDYYKSLLGHLQGNQIASPKLALRAYAGLGMHYTVTDRPAGAEWAFRNVAARLLDMKCGQNCIAEFTKMLFEGLAALRSRNVVNAITTLSLMTEQLEAGMAYDCCTLVVEEYQQDVLLVSGYLYLASTLDGCGVDPAVGDSDRNDALAVIQEKFKGVLDVQYMPVEGKPDWYTTRWIRECVEFIEKRRSRELDGNTEVPNFPFEIFWIPDNEQEQEMLLFRSGLREWY